MLRDLKEGDIAFGAGAGRGWGAVSAEIHGDPLTTMPDEAFTPVVEALVAYIRDRDAMSGAQRNTLKAAIDALPCGAPPITAPEPRLPTGGDVPLAAVPLAAAGAGSFYNPYHFAPMHSQVWGYPIEEWKQGQHPHVGHDRYVEHTWSGRIICTIEAKTPLVVGARIDSGTQNQPQRVIPFEIDGAPAVPGSSLRGMVSSIAEAASNSALRVLNDTHYSYRKEYRQGLSAIGRVRFKRDANGMAMKTRDGSDRYELQPLTYPALVSSQGHGWNECMMKDLADQGLAANDPNRRKWEGLFAVQNLKVYLNDPVSARAWTGSTLVGVQVPEIPDADINGDFLRPAMGNAHNYKTKPAQHPTILLGQNAQSATPVPWPTDDPVEIARLKGAGYRRGYLYVLGSSIGPRMRQMMIGKTHELFIPVPESLDTHNNWFDIPAAVVRAFHGLCAAVTETSRADEVGDLARPYHPVGTLRNNVDSENPDLFILKDGDLLYFDVDKKGDITELSLSSVWRAATKGGDHHTRGSAWAFFDAVHSELTPYTSRRKMLTLADAVFGVATDEKTSSPLLPQPGNAAVYDNGVAALAGRVRVASALWMHGHDRNFYEPEQTLRMMASPKPPSPALYFKRTNAAHQHPIKKTLTVGTHHPNGRKFYLHHRAGGESWQAPQAAVTQRPHLYSRVTPVRRETTFSFHIDVDNLSHEEIGLLMYALKPTPSFRHKLGMGKSTVLGSIEITVAGMWRVNRRTRYTADGLFAARYAEVLAGELVGISLPDRYRRERDAAVGVGPGTWPTQAAQEFRNACPALGPTRRALEMIGISEVVDVSWPLTAQQALAAQQQTAETQHFRWFGQNDMPNVAREVLKPLPESVNASLKKI